MPTLPKPPKSPIPRLPPLRTKDRRKSAYRKMQPAHQLRRPPTQSAISHVPKRGRIELLMERITVTRTWWEMRQVNSAYRLRILRSRLRSHPSSTDSWHRHRRRKRQGTTQRLSLCTRRRSGSRLYPSFPDRYLALHEQPNLRNRQHPFLIRSRNNWNCVC